MRPIDADALAALIQQEPTDGMYTEEIVALITEQPTIEASPVVHGRWDGPFRADANHYGYKCTECGFWGVPGWVACPNCGARMRGDGDG